MAAAYEAVDVNGNRVAIRNFTPHLAPTPGIPERFLRVFGELLPPEEI